MAFDHKKVNYFIDRELYPGKIYYPNELSATEFYRDIKNLQSDIFEIRNSLNYFTKQMKEKWGIFDSKIDNWCKGNTEQLKNISNQIDELESQHSSLILSVVSRLGFQGIIGGTTYDCCKFAVSILNNVIQKILQS
jgi:hypothetical protein